MSSKEAFEYAEKLSTVEAIEYVMEIAAGLRSPFLKLEGNGQALTLVPQKTVKLKIKAEKEDGKNRVKLELSWKIDPIETETKLGISALTREPLPVPSLKPAAKKTQVKTESQTAE